MQKRSKSFVMFKSLVIDFRSIWINILMYIWLNTKKKCVCFFPNKIQPHKEYPYNWGSCFACWPGTKNKIIIIKEQKKKTAVFSFRKVNSIYFLKWIWKNLRFSEVWNQIYLQNIFVWSKRGSLSLYILFMFLFN